MVGFFKPVTQKNTETPAAAESSASEWSLYASHRHFMFTPAPVAPWRDQPSADAALNNSFKRR